MGISTGKGGKSARVIAYEINTRLALNESIGRGRVNESSAPMSLLSLEGEGRQLEAMGACRRFLTTRFALFDVSALQVHVSPFCLSVSHFSNHHVRFGW